LCIETEERPLDQLKKISFSLGEMLDRVLVETKHMGCSNSGSESFVCLIEKRSIPKLDSGKYEGL
jgi:hypothetical protein